MKTHMISFVALSDVLEYMGYSDLYDNASDIFPHVTWGDSLHTIADMKYVLDTLYDYLDNGQDQTWTNNQAARFAERAEQMDVEYSFVDMEN